jgi:hypothetical protein
MWNTTENNSSTIFNAPANGIVQKSNKDSYFLRMHQNSELAKEIFRERPKHNDIKVTVLQVLLTHESWFLVELVHTDKL